MHGLINRSIQNYVCENYGLRTWSEAARMAALDNVEFEAMLSYDDTITPRVLDAVSAVLGRPRAEVMEDIGTYLASHPGHEAVRRLLRFGGVTFEDFLHSLDDLPDRARLAVSDLHLPWIELRAHTAGQFSLNCDARLRGYGHFLMGILRVMADDYGALVLLEHRGGGQGVETLSISLVEAEFAEGREFILGGQVE